MNTIEIDKDRLKFVVAQAVSAVAAHPFLHPLEVIFGLAEACGRTIAAQEGSYQVHNELLRVTKDHLTTTVRAAYAAAGNNPEGIK